MIKLDALHEALSVFADELLSDVYVGWVRGYLDEERAKFEQASRIPLEDDQEDYWEDYRENYREACWKGARENDPGEEGRTWD